MSGTAPEDLEALAAFAPVLAATFVSIASDIALVVDASGVIRHRAVGADALAASTEQWIGARWVDTVTSETRHKIEMLLQEAGSGRASRRREVSHPSLHGLDIPMAWAAIQLGEDGPVLAVGRDMRAVAAIQQRFVDSQQEIERDYWNRRRAESHYELLFQVANDAVFVISGESLLIVEANAAATRLLGAADFPLAGMPMTALIDATSRPLVHELLLMSRTTGRPAEVRAWLARRSGEPGRGQAVDVSAVPVRAPEAQSGEAHGRMLMLVRARTVADSELAAEAQRRFGDFVERTPDGIAITDSNGDILSANAAFVQWTGTRRERALHGRALSDVIGDSHGTLQHILARTRREGLAPATRFEVDQPGDCRTLFEVSAILLAEGDQECIGFTLRCLEQPLKVAAPMANQIAQALRDLGAELDAQLGHTPLHRLMDQAARVTEHHLIERAIERGGGDLDAAAQDLGVSREELETRRSLRAEQTNGPSPNGTREP